MMWGRDDKELIKTFREFERIQSLKLHGISIIEYNNEIQQFKSYLQTLLSADTKN